MFNRDAVDRHWRVIRHVTNKVWGTTFEGEFGSVEDVLALALEVASERFALWDAGTFPPGHDLRIHLLQKIRADRYARGWRQIKDRETGKRFWVTHGLQAAQPFGHDDRDPRLSDRTYDPDRVLFGDEAETYRLAVDWPEFTPRQRWQFARYMRARYPEACQAFEDLDRETKPPRTAWARWESERELRRARLRVTYARELAEARFAATYGLAA